MDYRKQMKLLDLTPELLSCTFVKIHTDFGVTVFI